MPPRSSTCISMGCVTSRPRTTTVSGVCRISLTTLKAVGFPSEHCVCRSCPHHRAHAGKPCSPATTFTLEMLPLYQQQTAELKNSVSNAALIGSILGQLFFGFSGDILGRKWNFFITSALIILGAPRSVHGVRFHALQGASSISALILQVPSARLPLLPGRACPTAPLSRPVA